MYKKLTKEKESCRGFTSTILKGVTHVMIVACNHPLLLPACMLHFDLVSMLFGTSIPTCFNIFASFLDGRISGEEVVLPISK